jgi:hypothetical protein
MGAINEVLNKHVNIRKGLAEEDLLSKLARLERAFSELERPEYREFIRFAVQWEELGRELRELQRKLHERMAEKPNPVNELLKKLVKKT